MERDNEPRFFGEHNEKFGWFFRLNEPHPRGQTSAMMMVAEVGEAGAWSRAFEARHVDKFTAPTVEGIEFPSLGVYQAWNDIASGTLNVGTCAPIPDRRGRETSWRIRGLPNPKDVSITRDGEPFARFEIIGRDSIRIDTTIDDCHYRIVTNDRGNARLERGRDRAASRTDVVPLIRSSELEPTTVRAASILLSGRGPACPCCPA